MVIFQMIYAVYLLHDRVKLRSLNHEFIDIVTKYANQRDSTQGAEVNVGRETTMNSPNACTYMCKV